jgi:hypothetical protein
MERFKLPLALENVFPAMSMEWFPEFVLKYLTFAGKCFRHCEKPTSMRVVSQDRNRFVGAYVCPRGSVSQVVYFSLKPEFGWFVEFLSSQVGEENVDPKDVRIASRHGWELGGDAQEILESRLGRGASIQEVYWTRYPKTEAQKQQVVSLCVGDVSKTGCMKLFVHDRDSEEKLCRACGAKYTNK